MSGRRRNCPAGATLTELLIALAVLGILGTVFVRGVMMEARVSEDREAWSNARRVAQSVSGRLAADLRMIETSGGVEYANSTGDTLVVRAPYAFGVLCGTDGAVSTIALLPVDSTALAAPGFSGFAWRSESSGGYTYVAGGTDLDPAGDESSCTEAGITPITGHGGSPDGRVVALSGAVPPGLAPGTVLFLFRRIRYAFAPSELVPGLLGLWRTALSSGTSEELAAPFDSTSRFAYLVEGTGEASEDPPVQLSLIRGIEVRLDGRSENLSRIAPPGERVVRMVNAIYFQNHRD